MGKTNVDNKSGGKTDLMMGGMNMDKGMPLHTPNNSTLNENLTSKFRKDEKSV